MRISTARWCSSKRARRSTTKASSSRRTRCCAAPTSCTPSRRCSSTSRALDGAGDLDGAIEGYEQYLEERPDAEDAGAIRARLQTLREQRARLEAEDAPEETDEPVEEVEDAPPETSEGGDDVMGILPWIVAGVGVVVIGAGVGLGLVALDYGEQAQNEPTMRRAVSLQDEGETYALIANLLYIAGGAIAAAGVAWGVIVLADGDGDDASANLRVLPGVVELSGAF